MNGNNPAAILFNQQGAPLGVDAFGRLRAWQPYALFDNYHKYEIDTHHWGFLSASGGTLTHLPNESSAKLAVTGLSGSRVLLRTHTHFRYQAGRGIGTLFTLIHTDKGQTGQVRTWGLNDHQNGIFFQLSGSYLGLVRRTYTSGAPVDTFVSQSAWNGDKLDGSAGTSYTLDITKGNIYGLDLTWLGVGDVPAYINGTLVHTLRHVNTYSVPYMTTAVLPMSFEVQNFASSSVGGFNQICSSIWSDGGQSGQRWSYGAYTVTASAIGTGTTVPSIAIRPKQLYNGIANRTVMYPESCSVSIDTKRGSFVIIANATITGGSWASIGGASAAEYNTGSMSVSGGEILAKVLVAQDTTVTYNMSGLFSHLGRKMRNDFSDTDGLQNNLVIVGHSEVAGTANIESSINWIEER